MLLRVRSNVGIWRVDGLDGTKSTIHDVINEITKTKPHVVYIRPLCNDPACTIELDDTKTLQQLQLSHGSMIYCKVDPSSVVDNTVAATAESTADGDDGMTTSTTDGAVVAAASNRYMRRIIDSDGQIKLVPTNEQPRQGDDKGFRKGLKALRDIKMHWTLSDFVAMDSQYEFKIQRQKDAICKQVSLESGVITKFQTYLQNFNFQRKRFAFLYGKFVDENGTTEDELASAETTKTSYNNNNNNKHSLDSIETKPLRATRVIVEAIYEPPQQIDNDTAEGFIPVDDDPYGDAVEKIASYLGWTRVGWIYGHETREPGYVMSAAEVIMAAEYQLEAANGVHETPFVTIKVAPSLTGQVTVEAFQVSQQCMSMVAEEALEVGGNDPKFCIVNSTFTAIQEGKASTNVENNFFITVVPIVQHTSERFISDFPQLNRDIDDRTPSNDELRTQLAKSGTAGWTFEDRLADFNLLIYLSQFLDVNTDFPKICNSLIDRSVPLDDGYRILIKSIAGLDSSY